MPDRDRSHAVRLHSRRTPAVFGACLFVLALFCAGGLSAQEGGEEDARGWLERMNHALMARNYDGTFFHLRNGRVETLRIVHRVEGGKVGERLVSLDGNGREIIRNDEELSYFLPDQKRVLVGQRQDRGPLMGTLPSFESGISEHYRLERRADAPLLGRNTHLITVNPKDKYRFGYRLWLDVDTAMPLKTQLVDSDGNVIEQVLFASLTLPERIAHTEVQSRVQSEGFTWSRQQAPSETQEGPPAWVATKLPPGFKLTATRNQSIEGSRSPRAQLVYTDGLAFVSVFVENAPEPANSGQRLQGPSRVGSAFAYSTLTQGQQITVVGEVPMITVRLIARSIRPQPAPEPAPAAP